MSTFEEIKKQPSNIQKAEILASKLDNLNKHFEVVESTIDECTEYVQSIENTIAPSNVEINDTWTATDSLTTFNNELLVMLRNDFMEARKTLLENIQNGRIVINAASTKLTMFDDSVDAELVSAYSALLKVTNDSTKILISLYKDIIKTQQEVSTKVEEKPININGDVTVNTISGNISDIIKQIKKSNESQ